MESVIYSQNYEQAAIERAVLGYGTKLLDIGAWDGITFSNSLSLIEYCWHGVLVEPSPIPFMSLLERHGRNPLLSLVHALVGVEAKPFVPMWLSEDGMSTTEKSNHDLWCDYADYKPPCNIPQVTIRQILEHFKLTPDFVNIDTEGTSEDLFRNYPFDMSNPTCFCIEKDGNSADLARFADSKGYKVTYESGENLVLVRR